MATEADGRPAKTLVWPTHRGSEDRIRARFGDPATDTLLRALHTGDTLADAVVSEIHSGDGVRIRRQIRQGITEGLGSLTDPTPSVTALLTSTETMPDFVDDALLTAGSRPYFSAPTIYQQIALGVGALVNIYCSPSIAKVLSNTGRLVDGTERRVLETGKWLLAAMLPNELRPGGAGYTATLQVRILHANIRWAQTRNGYNIEALGVPIGQADLARTWLDFTYTPYDALERLGIEFTAAEIDQVYRLWWYLGHLLGIDPSLYRGIRSQYEAGQLLQRLNATNEAANDQSAVLTDAVLGFVAQTLSTETKLPSVLSRSIVNSLAWRIQGEAKARELRVPRSPFTRILPLAAKKIRHDRAELRMRPDRWNAKIDMNSASARELLALPDDATAFQANLTGR